MILVGTVHENHRGLFKTIRTVCVDYKNNTFRDIDSHYIIIHSHIAYSLTVVIFFSFFLIPTAISSTSWYESQVIDMQCECDMTRFIEMSIWCLAYHIQMLRCLLYIYALWQGITARRLEVTFHWMYWYPGWNLPQSRGLLSRTKSDRFICRACCCQPRIYSAHRKSH